MLSCLLRHKEKVSYGCKQGVCHACILRATKGGVSPRSQEPLRDTLRAQGYFLACRCYPEGDLSAAVPGETMRVPATILATEWLTERTLKVTLTVLGEFEFHPGQFVNIIREDGLARSYSIANLPGDATIETHVRVLEGGAMSGWLKSDAAVGAQVKLQGPLGDCFYVPENPAGPLLLAGTGTGLAPLYGILRDALAHGHTGPIRLFHGAVDTAGLYLGNELRKIAATNGNVQYVPVVLQGEAPEGGRVAALDKLIAAELPDLNGWRAYLCGDPDLVRTLRRTMFLAGAAMKDIHADAFLPAA